MTPTQIVFPALGVGAIVWVLWYFLFSGGKAVAATAGTEGVQEVRITVKGGYTPDTIVVQAGKPVRLQFYRDERSEEHTSELQSQSNLVCRLLLEKKKKKKDII